MFQCVFFMHDAPTLGNIGERPLAQILREAGERQLYREFVKTHGECETCEVAPACAGGCRGYAYLYHGDWHRPDPRCVAQGTHFFPVCPIAKLNLRSGMFGGSSENALAAT
jgi:radical SAM protein with 4Fe4S-binding SPASM domain